MEHQQMELFTTDEVQPDGEAQPWRLKLTVIGGTGEAGEDEQQAGPGPVEDAA